MAGMNKIMDKEVETLLLASSDSVKSISSTIVRQILSLDGDTSKFLSSEVNNYLKNIK
jgi:pantetheine-phosphate adenylyltransferase